MPFSHFRHNICLELDQTYIGWYSWSILLCRNKMSFREDSFLQLLLTIIYSLKDHMLISIQEYFVKLLHSFVTSFIVKFPMKVPLNVFLLHRHKKYFSSQEMVCVKTKSFIPEWQIRGSKSSWHLLNQWSRSRVFIVNFEHILDIVLVFPLLILSR